MARRPTPKQNANQAPGPLPEGIGKELVDNLSEKMLNRLTSVDPEDLRAEGEFLDLTLTVSIERTTVEELYGEAVADALGLTRPE